MSKNGNEASFDTGAPFVTITPKQMRWLRIQPEASFVCVKNSIKPGRRVSSNVSSAFALSPAFGGCLRFAKIIARYEKRIGSRGESRNPRRV